MSKGKKIALGVIVFLVAIVAVLVIVVPLLIDLNRYRPQVIAHIQEETGKPAEIGKIQLTLFPPCRSGWITLRWATLPDSPKVIWSKRNESMRWWMPAPCSTGASSSSRLSSTGQSSACFLMGGASGTSKAPPRRGRKSSPLPTILRPSRWG